MRVSVQLKDQWGDRRKIKERFRADDESPDAMKVALQAARQRRDEILVGRKRIEWLRAEFPEPIEKRSHGSFNAFVKHHDKFQEEDKSQVTLEGFIELGLKIDHEQRFTIDPMTNKRGFLRRLLEDTSKSNFGQKRGIWVVVKNWGGIHRKRLEQIEGEDVDDFVRFLERQIDDGGEVRYARSSIRRYRMALRAMIKNFAVFQGKVNPLTVKPTKRNPTRIKGKPRKRKVPTEKELAALESGFIARIEQASVEKTLHHKHLGRRRWALHVHKVLRGTGMRPSEVLFLEDKHIDGTSKRLIIEGGAVDGEPGFTKTGKQKGSREAGARVIPIEGDIVRTITNWLEIRSTIGFPPRDKCGIIFCDEAGDYATADSLRTHYTGASDEGGLSTSITPYQMRHWRNDFLRRQGMPSEVRQALLGHIEKETNLNYADVKAEEARKWFDDE